MKIEQIAASRCPVCGFVAAPPARWCPRHPVEMVRTSVIGAGEVVSFTTLHSPPQGFRSPLHIALVELSGGARGNGGILLASRVRRSPLALEGADLHRRAGGDGGTRRPRRR